MRKRTRAVILDRDGVLNVDSGYVHSREEFQWVPGALQAVKRCTAAGYLVLVATNQSGVGRGYYDEKAVRRLHRWMNRQLREKGGRIRSFYFCPHHPDAGCACRKPNPGLFLRAIQDWHLDTKRSFSVGDSDRDIAASAAAGIRGFRFDGGNLAEFMRPLLKPGRL